MSIKVKHIARILKLLIVTIIVLILLIVALDLFFPFHPKISYSQTIVANNGTVLHAFLNEDDKWRLYTELDEITPELKKTIIFKEDKYFRYHFGINPIALARAFFKNIFKGEITSGASTITMQVARMLEPKPRTYKNKFIEMFRALQLEIHHSKNEILQMYLNLVPYGGNIEGVKSAALLYFEQKPQALSLAQIVSLSIIPNDPTNLRLGVNDTYILQERNNWLNYFKKKKLFDKEIIEDALNEPVTGWRHEAPKQAPHISYHLKRRFPDQTNIQSFINPDHQAKIEQLTYNYISRIRNMNITNAAVLVLDNKTNNVIAYLGSADFWDGEYQGQVDGVQSIRSPGSTLKPFLYALAIDKGLITPKYMITDVPINYSGYSPENYDGKYHGLISIERSLALSLNIPAVKTLDQLGEDVFIQNLRRAKFSQIEKDKDKLGLSLILGGCGVNLEEMTNLFSTFANQGIYRPVNYILKSDTSSYKDTLLTSASCFMITNILTMLSRPDLPNKYEYAANLPKVAWKTGTSYGRRDAWAIGYNTRYTVGVWLGNFPGIGVPELNGSDFAVPLLFSIFNSIDYKRSREWFVQPDNLDYRLVCSESGLLPNEFCSNLIQDAYIPGVSPHMKCQHMKLNFTNGDENLTYCRNCLPRLGYKKKLYRNYPADLISFYEDHQIPYEKPPPHNPECDRIHYNHAPNITSLINGMEYLLFKNESNKLMLRADAEHSVEKIHWYINDKLYKSTKPTEKIFFIPEAGEIKISCADDKGRNTDIWILVKYI